MARSARVLQALKIPILTTALVLPFAAAVVGALIARSRGGRAIDGAMAGVIVTAPLIGSAWIGLGVLGGWRELRDRSRASGRD